MDIGCTRKDLVEGYALSPVLSTSEIELAGKHPSDLSGERQLFDGCLCNGYRADEIIRVGW